MRDLFPRYASIILSISFITVIWSYLELQTGLLYNLFVLEQVKTLVKLYAKEQYVLMVNQQPGDFEVFISFKVCM